ncbi:tol-pal system protein YbgF [Salinisphaera sp. Q1T1-3]|uniref:tol-pal system protein YbgF n=1 Tax=Salinisphaera sp. Q1T1-3 TaxID=2321229 RepID=UPI000E72BC5E|nr:tol-pal system protein YbgF [Salinisphaera sp. Q1T1-3]RJS95258.1 tol-pal system protein YbgF [Salinisphaera sp. Q1T1-3]
MVKPVIISITAATIGLATVALPAGAAFAASQPMQLAQNNSGPNLFALYQQIQQLQQQVRDLNGQVDTLQYKLKQQEQGQRDLYQNLDKRLSALENGTSNGQGEGQSGGNGSNGEQPSANVAPDVQSAYMDAFNKLKGGQYDQAASAFKQFVQAHPDTPLTGNAWYWLGEASYVQQNLDESREAFERVVNRFQASPKVPSALYKIGLIQTSQNQNDNAKATFQRILDQYPDSNAASQAKTKLDSLGS